MAYMNNKALSICIVFSLCSVLLIAFLESGESVRRVRISDVNSKMIGDAVEICGIVKSKSVSPSETVFITLADGKSKMPLVFFKNEKYLVENASRGSDLCAKGNVQIYNGTIEIIGKKVSGFRASN